MGESVATRLSILSGRLFQRLRPHLCPFDQLAEYIPLGASVLDVGCGNGVFLGILAESGRIRAGHGVDRSKGAIRDAQRIGKGKSGLLRFEAVDSLAELSDCGYDAVTIVDVVHHIPEPDQLGFFIDAASKLRPGGTLIYKDISAGHKFWRLCNTLHDLAKAGQLAHYVSEDRLGRAAGEAGLELVVSLYVRKLWYMHVIQIFHRPSLPNAVTQTGAELPGAQGS